MKSHLIAGLCALALTLPVKAAEQYEIDTGGMHAFVQFKISHLGYSWLYGRFNDFEGEFTFDPENPANSAVQATIQTASVDTNHERRDKHLRSDDFLDVENHPEATFVSTDFVPLGDDRYRLEGEFTLRGVTREVEIDVTQIGAGEDPWGGFRRGFQGRTELPLEAFGIDYDLGPAAEEVEIILSIEGVRQDEAE
ncbi:YceI family protein [Wenzhouxiangella sediminis]|jgi:polyisoprenoid-binding protein YceI|uniref:YceI family protein n=1 Tax=Wenzhouxiangella sediminis TaxID=1792836 RepID=A0A3E1KCH8_9GAMM|nr:YceI family protein [Wenzhouxiangella sediminis]RFF32599.1 YceI family protein [Wenzhouxiangella sediminis]